MTAQKGDIDFSFAFETRKKQLLDAKMYAENYADLFTYTTDRYLFKMPVFVAGLDDPSKQGWWLLLDPEHPELESSWSAGNQPVPFNQVIQIGSYSYDEESYVATMGATLDWIFNENGVNIAVGEEDVQLEAPDDTYPRADLIVWSSSNGYEVVKGDAAEDFVIPNTPVGTILARTIIRNVDGSTDPIDPPDLSAYAKNEDVVHKTGNLAENITGIKTFFNTPHLKSGITNSSDYVFLSISGFLGAIQKPDSPLTGNRQWKFQDKGGIIALTSDITSALTSYQLLSEKNENNGYAGLDAGGKIPFSLLPATLLIYKGVWDASTNTPELEDGTGTPGDMYRVTGAPTPVNHDFGSGDIEVTNGDYLIYNSDNKWEKSDGTDAVTSVNGQQGTVTLDTDDIEEGSTNLYYTDDRVQTIGDARYVRLSPPSTQTGNIHVSGYIQSNGAMIAGGDLTNNASTSVSGEYYFLVKQTADNKFRSISGVPFAKLSGTPTDNDALASVLDTKADLVGGVIPANQLPGFVDDVLEGTYIDSTTFNDPDDNPYTPEAGKVYVDTITNKTYRWSGSAYIMIGSDLALGETSATAYRGDRGKTAYDHSQTTGNPHNTAIGDISGLQSAIDAKLTGTLAADADLQTQTTPSEDSKFVSRHGLIYFWNWLKTQTVNIAASWSFTKGLFGTTTAKNAHITVAASTSTTAQINLAPGAEYIGNESGAINNVGGELKFYDGTGANRILKALSNAVLAGSTNRSVSVNASGDISANDEEIEGFVMDTDVIDAITGATYTSDRATITPDDDKVMHLGQMYDDGTYTYLAIGDNEVRRW